MKVALICRVFPTHRGGGMPYVCYDRAETLAALGVETHVITSAAADVVWETPPAGVVLHHAPDGACGAYSPQFAKHCVKILHDIGPVNITHLDSFSPEYQWWLDVPTSIRGTLAVTLHGVNVGMVLTRANIGIWRGWSQTMPDLSELRAEADALPAFDKILTVSHDEQELVDLYYGLQSDVVYNPIDKRFFSPVSPPPGAGVIGAAAISGQTERGFDLLQGIRGCTVRIVAKHRRAEMPAEYDKLDLYVLPTFFAKGFDLCVAEALARGRPVIATAVGSYRRTGLLGIDTFSQAVRSNPDKLRRFIEEYLVGLGQRYTPKEIATTAYTWHPDNHVRNWLYALTGSYTV